MPLLLLAFATLLLGGQQPVSPRPAAAAPSTLDFEFFKTRVQPIFMAKRPGHARCIDCHAANLLFPMRPLPAEGAGWSEDDSRRNFEAASRFVVPGSAQSSLLLHPLAQDAGG